MHPPERVWQKKPRILSKFKEWESLPDLHDSIATYGARRRYARPGTSFYSPPSRIDQQREPRVGSGAPSSSTYARTALIVEKKRLLGDRKTVAASSSILSRSSAFLYATRLNLPSLRYPSKFIILPTLALPSIPSAPKQVLTRVPRATKSICGRRTARRILSLLPHPHPHSATPPSDFPSPPVRLHAPPARIPSPPQALSSSTASARPSLRFALLPQPQGRRPVDINLRIGIDIVDTRAYLDIPIHIYRGEGDGAEGTEEGGGGTRGSTGMKERESGREGKVPIQKKAETPRTSCSTPHTRSPLPRPNTRIRISAPNSGPILHLDAAYNPRSAGEVTIRGHGGGEGRRQLRRRAGERKADTPRTHALLDTPYALATPAPDCKCNFAFGYPPTRSVRTLDLDAADNPRSPRKGSARPRLYRRFTSDIATPAPVHARAPTPRLFARVAETLDPAAAGASLAAPPARIRIDTCPMSRALVPAERPIREYSLPSAGYQFPALETRRQRAGLRVRRVFFAVKEPGTP
ncbi:hypothetical protein B0H11DRAFT_2192907 [Mycena galericulata]|nr:hypothetical protein B0H11DRAFT_2192907 [Mycena galericulata]